MEDDEQETNILSLTKGCYVFKPTSQTKESKKSSQRNEQHWKSRHDLFLSTWQLVNSEIEALHKQIFTDIVMSVTDFACKTCKENREQDIIISEIPTAALILGVNISDHFLLFHQLRGQFRESVTPFIVSMKSEDGGTFASLVQSFVYRLVESTDLDNEEASSDIRKQDCTFQFVQHWYKENEDVQKVNNGRSPSKIRKNHGSQTVHTKGRPVIVIFEDVEAFNPYVLQDFILTCNNYAMHIPFIFVMGVASVSGAVHHLLPQKALSCLTIKTFHSSPATEYINNLINKVVISSEVPFKLGPRVFQLIVDIILFHDFSIANFSHMLKLCMFEHFYENESSELCCPLSDVKGRMESLPLTQLKEFCRLPSVARYLEENKDVRFGTRNSMTDFIYTCLKVLHDNHRAYITKLTCLHAFIKNLPSNPMGKQLREMYISGLESRLSDTGGFKQTFKILSLSSKDDLQSRIQQSISALHKMSFDSPTREDLMAELENFLSKLKEAGTEVSTNDQPSLESVKPEIGKILSRSQLKEKLKARSQEQKLTPYEYLRKELLHYLWSLFADAKPLCSLPLNEALYFNAPGMIRKMLIASPRMSYHRALTAPHEHLQCKCCSVEDVNQILSTLPAVSIAYKLYLECGRLINLCDWLQAFKAIRTTGSEDSKRKSRRKTGKDKEALIHAQFMHSVSELNFLGFVKPTTKKKDHVEKLVWNSSV